MIYFADMRAIPRLIQWILSLAIFFLTAMFLWRLAAWMAFEGGHHPFRETLPAFILGFRYDARMVSIFLLIILLLGSIKVCSPFRSIAAKNAWLVYTGLITTAFFLFYVFDFVHYRYLSQRLNASALGFLEDTKISAGMVWQTYPVLRILLGMILGVYVVQKLIAFLLKKAAAGNASVSRRSRTSWFVGCLLVFGVAIFGRLGQYPLRWSDAFNTGSDFNANIALNPFQSFFSSLSFRTSGFDKAVVKKYYPYMATYLGVDKPNADSLNFSRTFYRSDTGLATRPNIVLVICESFSAYKSSMWGNPLNTTPFFIELSKKGIFFDNCFTPHFGTARGVWATITGIPDVEFVKTASRNPAMVDQHTIINDFQGYQKLYFLGGSTSWANIRGLLTNNIKELHLYEEGSYDVPAVDVWGISDKNLFLEANKVLGKQQEPFFAVIQTADNHRPYTIPEEDRTTFKTVELPVDTIRKYGFESNGELNAFRYTDFSFRTFIEAAEKSPYFKNTIFAFVGDHGIHGNAGDMFPPAWTDNGLDGYHVPMLFYAPGLIEPKRYHTVASQVDMLPTLAGLANITYTNTTLGRDLLKPPAAYTGERDNVAFIMDHNNKNQGVVKDSLYYNRMPAGGKEAFVWANFAQAPTSIPGDTIRNTYSRLTTAFFETARYMLMNNRKK